MQPDCIPAAVRLSISPVNISEADGAGVTLAMTALPAMSLRKMMIGKSAIPEPFAAD